MDTETRCVGTAGSRDVYELFVDWMWFLVEERLSAIQQYGHSTRPDKSEVYEATIDKGKIGVIFEPNTKSVSIETALGSQLHSIVKEAQARSGTGDRGNPVWWCFALKTSAGLESEAAKLHMFRSMGQYRRFAGTWRLGIDVLVKFEQKAADNLPLFPSQELSIYFQATGLGRGPSSQRIAKVWAGLIRSTLCLVTASPLSGFMMVRQPKVGDEAMVQAAMLDGSIPELNINGVFPWQSIAAPLANGATECAERIFNAMIAFEHALSQRTAPAALVFYITALEALATPNQNWANRRVTKRFVELLLLQSNDKLRATLGHPNFGDAFGTVATIKELAEKLYSLRSKPVHTGQLGIARELWFGGHHADSVQVALIGELVEVAITRFMDTPVSLLYGHPMFDPDVRLALTSTERDQLEKEAITQRCSVESLIRTKIGLTAE